MPSVTEVLQQFFFMNGKLNGGHLKPHDIVRHCVSKGIKALNFVLGVGGGNGKLRTGVLFNLHMWRCRGSWAYSFKLYKGLARFIGSERRF